MAPYVVFSFANVAELTIRWTETTCFAWLARLFPWFLLQLASVYSSTVVQLCDSVVCCFYGRHWKNYFSRCLKLMFEDVFICNSRLLFLTENVTEQVLSSSERNSSEYDKWFSERHGEDGDETKRQIFIKDDDYYYNWLLTASIFRRSFQCIQDITVSFYISVITLRWKWL